MKALDVMFNKVVVSTSPLAYQQVISKFVFTVFNFFLSQADLRA